jgi:membrane protease YdiL (CAAX protease family)
MRVQGSRFRVPYEPRRPVPWRTADLLILVLFYVAAQGAAGGAIQAVCGARRSLPLRTACEQAAAHDAHGGQSASIDATCMEKNGEHRDDESVTSHFLVQLMESGNPWVLLLCAVSAILVAPVFEEFFFRVLLQGWLEAIERRGRRRFPWLRRQTTLGAWPILLSAILFAAMHFRTASPRIETNILTWLLIGSMAANLATAAFAVCWLRWRVGASAADFGWVSRKFPGDLRLGLAAFAVVAIPVFGIQIVLYYILPEWIAPDPIALFVLALVLGTLYYRTHRMAPSVIVHAALNATSIASWLLIYFYNLYKTPLLH